MTEAAKEVKLVGMKHYPDLSEETLCFQTAIAVDGRKSIFAENRGTGGATFFSPRSAAGKEMTAKQRAAFKEDMAKLEAYARAQPPVDSPFSGEPLRMDAELLVFEMVAFEHEKKRLKRSMGKKLNFAQPDGEKDEYACYTIKAAYSPEVAERVRQYHEGAVVLNELDPDEATRILMGQVKPSDRAAREQDERPRP